MGIDRIASSGTQVSRILLGAVFSLSTLVSARVFEVTDQQREACTPDAFRLCSSEMPDANRVAACMAAKKAGLSAALPRGICHLQFGSISRLTTARPSSSQGLRASPQMAFLEPLCALSRNTHGLPHHAWLHS